MSDSGLPPTLLRALDAHGGLDRYRGIGLLRARFSARGLAFAMKLRGLRRREFDGSFNTRGPLATLHDFPREGLQGHLLDGGAVAIETDSGEQVKRRDHPREEIRSPRRLVRWDDLDLLYFCSYAAWGYFTAPFHLLLPGIEVVELPESRLQVRYPAGFPAHSREQVLYFGVDGLLRRVDYTAEVFGGWARAAHVCREPRELGGLVHPTRRRVHPRGPSGRPIRPVTLVAIEVHDVTPSNAPPPGTP